MSGFGEAQIKQLTELISITMATTLQQQAAVAPSVPTPPAATSAAAPQMSAGPKLQVDIQPFSGDEVAWDEWHKVYISQARILGFAGELTATEEIKVGAEDFNSEGIDPIRVKRASEAWLSLITACKGTALDIVQSTDSPSEAWRLLLQRYRATGLKEKSRLMREFNSLRMELGEDPKKFIMRVDRVARELRRVGKAVDEDDKNLAILNGLTPEYIIQRQMLEGGDVEPTRAHIEKVTTNQYDRLREDKSKAGVKALAVTARPGQNKT